MTKRTTTPQLPVPKIGHRFLVAAHDTFALLATQPNMGWHSRRRHPHIENLRMFGVRGFKKMLILYLPCPDGVEILRVIHGSRDLQDFMRGEALD
jgi:toxin ParE1/3/4